MKGVRQKIRYAEAPSGYVALYEYKEPFVPFEGGHGYQGALVYDWKTGEVQCHLCGEWMEMLGTHLYKTHGVSAEDYKYRVGLRRRTGLVGCRTYVKLRNRPKPKNSGLRPWKKGRKVPKAMCERIKAGVDAYHQTMEHKNRHNTCPVQLIDRLYKLRRKLGHVPSWNECGFAEALSNTFGSWEKALEKAGMTPNRSGVNRRFVKARVNEILNHLIQRNLL